MDSTIFIRIAAVFLGLVFGFFSYRIFVLTKGSSKGWTFLTWAGIILSAWAILQILLIGNPVFVNITSLIGFTAISILLPFAIITLDKNFGINLNIFFSKKYATIFYALAWAVMLLINLVITQPKELLLEFSGISLFLLGIMSLYTIYPAFKMWSNTNKWFWLFILIFIALMGISMPIGAYAIGGCQEIQLDACEGFSAHYAKVIPVPHTPAFIAIAANYNYILLPGLILGALGFAGIWKQLR